MALRIVFSQLYMCLFIYIYMIYECGFLSNNKLKIILCIVWIWTIDHKSLMYHDIRQQYNKRKTGECHRCYHTLLCFSGEIQLMVNFINTGQVRSLFLCYCLELIQCCLYHIGFYIYTTQWQHKISVKSTKSTKSSGYMCPYQKTVNLGLHGARCPLSQKGH